LAYEIEPEGQGRSFNLNDSPEVAAPLALNPTYFNWAMSGWNSGLSSWLWLHTAGSLGTNFGAGSDWTGTILWNRPVPVVEPGSVLPASRVWEHRGLYYYRSGWPSGASSNDFVFSFFSGKFEGGHAQEDQNQFALTAYGSAFAVDHGSGNAAKESEAHNMVFIDGQGQHNAGASIGTDGRITGYLLGAFADVVAGDATAAYTTYSPFNAHDVPFPGTDWSWGYSGANPVRFALRTVTVVHGAGLPAYALVMDDIDKDGALHTYDWRLHTDSGNVVDTGANPISVTGTGAHMELHLIDPDFSAVAVTTAPFNVGNGDPASTLIRVSRAAVNPKFTFLMLPLANGTSPPSISRQSQSWGCGATINWPGSKSDIIVRNDSGSAVTYSGVTTDGAVAVVRKHGSVVDAYMMEKGSTLAISGTTYATLSNGPASCEWSDGTVELDRYDADFRILDKGVNVVLYRDQQLGFVVDNGYVVPGGTTAVGPSPAASDLQVHAHPNPFNPETTIEIDGVNHRRVTVVVYDVAGRRVRTLWTGVMDAARALSWNGRDDRGAGVASGSYFVRVESSGRSQTVKITLLK
ncbi:MAG TPA: FlgD immunoglobulin-like domain containing protein, partial [Candidatus Krumholzibacteria bacterium]|nr:FlgD immunoglobulin-like domain containing protein [Candidatus Krumholzibacteria bacterium]